MAASDDMASREAAPWEAIRGLQEGVKATYGKWEVHTTRGPIADKPGMEALTEAVGFEPPEMVFTSSFLELKHSGTGLTLRFDAADALKKVLPSGVKPVQVAAAKQWRAANQTAVESASKVEEATGTGPSHDWTFTTTYSGSLSIDPAVGAAGSSVSVTPSAEGIDFQLLGDTSVPIDAFDDVDLFESELDDNGQSRYHVKVRCMGPRTYILARLWLRVDKVLLRAHETRVWCEHDGEVLVREYCEKEASWGSLKAEGHISMRDAGVSRRPDEASSLLTTSLTVKEAIAVSSG